MKKKITDPALAEELNGADSGPENDDKQFVVFQLGGETYGIEISRVREIIVMQELTTLPRTAEYVKGIINLRGTVIPVYDLAGKFGLDSSAATKSTRIMVVEVKGYTVGMIVDMVSEVVRIPPEVIEPPSSLMTNGLNEQFIEGIANYSDRLIIILNLGNTLAADISFAC
ncbi:MAG: chemotaxis protein CheW [Firmicutes bacterium HGW-Firmicutes-14]|nr:MAG: chemotaxis protein CheW [Firmicutes bacterium HGW-Firmicutes-14]